MELDNTILDMANQISKLKHDNKNLVEELSKTKTELTEKIDLLEKSEKGLEEATVARIEAEEIARTFEETVKSLQKRMRDEKAKYNELNEMVVMTCSINNERDQMASEEIVSRYGMMEAELKAALEEK